MSYLRNVECHKQLSPVFPTWLPITNIPSILCLLNYWRDLALSQFDVIVVTRIELDGCLHVDRSSGLLP